MGLYCHKDEACILSKGLYYCVKGTCSDSSSNPSSNPSCKPNQFCAVVGNSLNKCLDYPSCVDGKEYTGFTQKCKCGSNYCIDGQYCEKGMCVD